MRALKMFAIALTLVVAGFVLVMLKDPPRLQAADPARPAIQPLELTIPTGIPTGAYDAN
jgi:hypothetical protein